DKLRLHFQHTDEGLKAKGDKLTGFMLAGSDDKFIDADATIDADAVIVTIPPGMEAVHLRYAFADAPPVSLYNGADLPASPFVAEVNAPAREPDAKENR